MKNSLETRLGLFFALVVVAGFLLYEITGGTDLLRGGRTVRARFTSVQDLKVGDPVKLGGVPVGRVTRIALAGTEVEVSMRVTPDAPLRTDSTAVIRFAGLMGQNFVSVDFGTAEAPPLAADALLQTREQPDLASVMSKLEGVADGVQNMTRSFTGEEFSKLLGPLTEVVRDNQPRISTILSNLAGVSDRIASGSGTVGLLINDRAFYDTALSTVTNLNQVGSRTAGLMDDLEGLIGDTRAVVAGVNAGQGTLGQLVKDPTLANETTSAMTNLKEILQKINQGQGSVGQLVNDATFLRNVKLTLQKVDKATETLEDTGPLSVIGTAVQTLF